MKAAAYARHGIADKAKNSPYFIKREFQNADKKLQKETGEEAEQIKSMINQMNMEERNSYVSFIVTNPKIPENEKKAIARYTLAKARFEGMQSGVTKEAQDHAEERAEKIRENSNTTTGEYTIADLNSGSQVIVVAGSMEDEGDSLTVQMADGERKQIPKSDINTESVQSMPSELLQEQLKESIIASSAESAQDMVNISPLIEPPSPGESTFIGQDGRTYQVTDVLPEAGNVVIGQPVDENGDILDEIMTIPMSEYFQMKQAEIDTSEELENQTQDIPKNTTNIPENEDQDKKITGDIISEQEKQNNSVEQETVSNIESIIANAPKQKNGEVDYDALLESDPESFATLYESEEGIEETLHELNSVSGNLGKRIESAKKKLDNSDSINKRKAAKAEIANLEGRKRRIDDIIQTYSTVENTSSEQEQTEISGSQRIAAEQSRKIQEEINNEPRDIEELAAQMLASGAIRLNWSDEGAGRGLKAETGWGEGERRNMLGILASRAKGGMNIQEAGDRLMEYAREMGYSFVDQEDANAGRNAIIGLLRGARTWGNVSNYIADRRKEQEARQRSAEEEYQRQMYEEYIQNRYHMTPEEYELYEESFVQRLEEEIRDLDENELNAIFAEAYQKQEEYERRNEKEDQGSNESSDPRATENIQGELTGSQESGSSEQSEISGPDGTASEERQESTITGTHDGANVVGDEHFRTLTAELTRLEDLTGRTNAQLFPDENSLLNQGMNDGMPDEDLNQIQQTFKRARREEKLYPGFFYTPTGKIYLCASQIENIDDLHTRWAHEQAHAIIASNFTKETLEAIYDSVGEKRLHKKLNPHYFEGNISKAYLAEEYLTHTIERIISELDSFNEIFNGEYYLSDEYRLLLNEQLKNSINNILNEIYRVDGRSSEDLRRVGRYGQEGEAGISENREISESPRLGKEIHDSDIERNDQNNLSDSLRRESKDDGSFPDRSREGQIKLEKLKEQEAQIDTNPSEAQKEAGNYKMGHIKLGPYDVTIETPAGTVRSGVDPNGNEWSVTMNNTYGYFRGTKGKDGDHIDVFLGPDLESPQVYVVDQVNQDGSFDEHKVMWGFSSKEEARDAYLSNYSPGWKGLGSITGVPREVFDEWMSVKTKKQKPFAEYKITSQAAELEQSSYTTNNGEVITFRHKGKLPNKEEGEFCHAERVFRESGSFCFTGKEKIETADDVAYIFRELENSSVENVFVVLVNEGKPTIVHLGMGMFTQTVANLASIKAAYDSIGAQKIYFVHNHPSGTLKCSRQDVNLLKIVSDMFEDDIVEDGIIINTTSGEYGTFDLEGSQETGNRPESQEEFPLKLLSFDKTVFSRDYNIQNLSVIRSSEDVAALVSSQRLGNRQKVSYLILDPSNKVIGNLHTTFETVKGNEKSLANEISSNVIRFGGVNAIVYGDFDIQGFKPLALNREIERISGKTVRLLDCVSADGLNTKSASDEGLMESEVRYNTGELSSENNDISYRQSNNEEAEKVNEKFNQELEKLTEENSNSTTLHLGTPSAPLISAGIPKKPFLLYGNKLIKKAKKHGFNVRDVKNLPISLSNPIAVFEGSHPNSYAILTEMSINGNNVLVSIETRKTGEIDFNLVSSVFGKEGKGIINWINEGKLRYAKKNQALNYLRTPALIAGATNNQELDSAANIIQSFENPTLEEGKIISEVENLADELHTPVKIIRNTDEITGDESNKKRGSKGWYDPKSSEVVLVLPNAESVEDAVATVLHEAVAHKGLRELLGKDFDKLCEDVYNSISADQRNEIAQKYGLDPNNESDRRAIADEYMASIAENGVGNPSVWNKIKAWFKSVLQKMGMGESLSDNDIAYLLWKSKNRLMEGDIGLHRSLSNDSHVSKNKSNRKHCQRIPIHLKMN